MTTTPPTLPALVRQAIASGSTLAAACRTVAADHGRDADWLYQQVTGRKPRRSLYDTGRPS